MSRSIFPALLVLDDGTILRGRAFGARAEAVGELVLCTEMAGYQEALSDPAFSGKIVLFTLPELGNVGVHPEDSRSEGIQAKGVVAKRVAPAPSSHRATDTLPSWLEEGGVPGIQGLDTRMLAGRLRERGRIGCALSTIEGADPSELRRKAEAIRSAMDPSGPVGGEG